MPRSVLFTVLLAVAVVATTIVAAYSPRLHFGRPRHGFLNSRERLDNFQKKPFPCLSRNKCGYDHVTQRVDNFDSKNNATFLQRYQYNFDFYNNSGLVFFMLGGESAIGGGGEKWAFNEDVAYITWAKKHGAAVFQAEHRFFGTSRPKPDQSMQSIVYLTIEQALADYAHFIDAMNAKYFANVTQPKWLTFGGSYPGSLSAWFRASYPEKTIGAISTSSAVNVFTDYYGYVDNVGNNIKDTDKDCYAKIKDGFTRMQTLMFSADGRGKLNTIFNVCTGSGSLPTTKDVPMTPKISQNFFQNVYGVFQGVNQYTYDNRGLSHLNITLEAMCDVVNNNTDSVQAIAEVLIWDQTFALSAGEKVSCLDNDYAGYINTYKNGTYGAQPDDDPTQEGRSWSWLTCTALGYFQTTDGGNDGIFGSTVPADFFVDQCIDLFNGTYNAKFIDNAVLKYRKKYGGAHNYKGTKCVFPNGSYDPWKDLGLLAQDANEKNEVYTLWIEKGAHCSDMYPATKEDSTSLTAARMKIGHYVEQFINEAHTKSSSKTLVSVALISVIAFLTTLFD